MNRHWIYLYTHNEETQMMVITTWEGFNKSANFKLARPTGHTGTCSLSLKSTFGWTVSNCICCGALEELFAEIIVIKCQNDMTLLYAVGGAYYSMHSSLRGDFLGWKDRNGITMKSKLFRQSKGPTEAESTRFYTHLHLTGFSISLAFHFSVLLDLHNLQNPYSCYILLGQSIRCRDRLLKLFICSWADSPSSTLHPRSCILNRNHTSFRVKWSSVKKIVD